MSEKEMEGKNKGSIIITCPECRRNYRLDGSVRSKPDVKVRCANCGNVFPVQDAQEEKEAPPPTSAAGANEGGARVLVATDGFELRGLIEEVLIRAGFEMRSAEEGDDAWAQIMKWRPRLAIIDVGLPGVPSFEICDRARSNEEHSHMGIILVASVFQRTRYKRAPTSLYGADDYIEKHHLRDSLVKKIERIVRLRAKEAEKPDEERPGDYSPDGEKIPPSEEKILVKDERFAGEDKVDSDALRLKENLKRFARIIISDIALYNQEVVERGIREGNLHQVLKKEIAEGKQLYSTRVPPSEKIDEDFYRQAFDEFVASQKQRFEEERNTSKEGE